MVCRTMSTWSTTRHCEPPSPAFDVYKMDSRGLVDEYDPCIHLKEAPKFNPPLSAISCLTIEVRIACSCWNVAKTRLFTWSPLKPRCHAKTYLDVFCLDCSTETCSSIHVPQLWSLHCTKYRHRSKVINSKSRHRDFVSFAMQMLTAWQTRHRTFAN